MSASPSRKIEPDAIYTTKQAAFLAQMHPETLRRKIRAGLCRAKGGKYRILGRELLKLA
jgi:hypothetical protein